MWLGFTSSFQKPFTAIPRKVLNFWRQTSAVLASSLVVMCAVLQKWFLECAPSAIPILRLRQAIFRKSNSKWLDSLHSSPRQRKRYTLRNSISSIRLAARSSWAKIRYDARLCWSDSEQKTTGSFATFFFRLEFCFPFLSFRFYYVSIAAILEAQSKLLTVIHGAKWARLGNAFVVIIHLQFTWCGFSIR